MKLHLGRNFYQVVGSLLLAFFCATPTKQGGGAEELQPKDVQTQATEGASETAEQKAALEKIRSTYEPIPCFRTGFTVYSSSGQGQQPPANGVLRADNLKNRMHMIFTDTVFGITLAQLTLTPEEAFLTNPREQGVHLPMDKFELHGLGNNNIHLPFHVLQELLSGKMPADVLSAKSVVLKEKTVLISFVKEEGSYEYEFENGRFRRLRYTHKGGDYAVDVNAKGQYKESIFPSELHIKAQGSLEETLAIYFNSLLTADAKCTDVYFPMR